MFVSKGVFCSKNMFSKEKIAKIWISETLFKNSFTTPPQNLHEIFPSMLQNRKKLDVPDVCKYSFFLEWCLGWSQVFRFSTAFKYDFSSRRYAHFFKKSSEILAHKVGGVVKVWNRPDMWVLSQNVIGKELDNQAKSLVEYYLSSQLLHVVAKIF